MKNKKLGLIIFLIVLINGCSYKTELVITPSQQSDPSRVPATLAEKAQPKATGTSVLKTQTIHGPQRTLTPSALPALHSPDIIPVCPDMGSAKALKVEDGIPGMLLYQNENDRGIYSMYGKPILFGQLSVDQNNRYFFLGVSPDHTWLAFSPIMYATDGDLDFSRPVIELLSIRGERRKTTLDISQLSGQLEPDYRLRRFGDSYWINDHLIYTQMISELPKELQGSNIPVFLTKVFDAFSGAWQHDLSGFSNRFPSQPFGISPNVEKALYMRKAPFDVALMDLANKETLWTSELSPGVDSSIRWAPNSSMAAYTNRIVNLGEHRVFIVTQDEKESQLILDDRYGVMIREMEWSPNSRYLAMVGIKIPAENIPHHELYLYDTATSTYLYRCPVSESFFTPQVVWSPDNMYLAISSKEKGKHIRLFSTKTGDMYEVGVAGVAVGWLDKYPSSWP